MLYSIRMMYLKRLHHVTFATIICNTRNLSCGIFPGVSFPQLKEPEQRWQHSKLQRANIHTTQTLNLSAIGIMMACTTMQFGSVIGGFYVRRWWLSLPPELQAEYRTSYQGKRNIIYGSVGAFYLTLLIFYLSHLEKDPIEKRRRFIIFNKEEQATLGNAIFTALIEKYKNHLIPASDPMYARLKRVIHNIGRSNRNIFENTEWTINIVDLPSPNAMVFSGGNVFMFSGIFDVIQNDDQLTFILAHEMSHVLLLHMAELFSHKVLEEIMYIVPLFLIWAIFSKWIALMVQLGSVFLYNILVMYPYRRRLELEADKVGFQLSARSCIDLREVLLFWDLMGKYEELTQAKDYVIPALMTHPDHITRRKKLSNQLPGALKLRNQAGCPALPLTDPQTNLPRYLKALEERYRNKQGITEKFS